jgi:hypothetical protein
MNNLNPLIIWLLICILFGNGIRGYNQNNENRAIKKELAEIKQLVKDGFYCGAER